MRKWTEEDLDADDSVPEPQTTVAKPEAEKTEKSGVTALQATIELARRGRKEILPKLRQVLDENPELWKHFGNLTLQAQETWLRLVAGKDLYLTEALRRNLDAMRGELAGTSPLERILVDRILACHVQVVYFESHEAQNPGGQNAKLDDYRMKRQDQAHRQFLSAVKTLATVRQLAAKTIQVELIHRPPVQAPVTPILSGANSEDAGMHNQKINGVKNPINGHNKFNGVNRFNGNRLAGVVEPMGVGEG